MSVIYIKNKKQTTELASMLLDYNRNFKLETINGSQWSRFTFSYNIREDVGMWNYITTLDWTCGSLYGG